MVSVLWRRLLLLLHPTIDHWLWLLLFNNVIVDIGVVIVVVIVLVIAGVARIVCDNGVVVATATARKGARVDAVGAGIVV